MAKRILVVSQHFWPEPFRINDICDGFVERGYEVDVLCGIPNYPQGQYYDGYGITKNRRQVNNGIRIRRCFEIKRGRNSNLRIFLNYISFPISSVFSLPYLLRQKYDKIFLYQTSPVMMTYIGIILGRLKKIETTMYVLDLWPENLYSVLEIKNKMLRSIVSRISNWHYKNVDKIVANSQRLLEILSERTCKDSNKMTFIPQFCEKLYEEVVKDEDIISRFSKGFNLVFTGNISPAQSFETVISAAKILKTKGYNDIKWIIIGDGMSKKWFQEAVESEGLNECFDFIGHQPITEIPKYTYVADVLFACLSKSDMLDCALPAKVISYYAAGRPMVFAMDGEVQQIMESSKAGYAVDAEDSESFAGAIEKVYLADKDIHMKMGENAKGYYHEHFHRDMNIEKLDGFMFS